MSEWSKGKMRPSLTRSSDLPAVPRTERDPAAGRTADGRFAPGNGSARARGVIQAVKKALGSVDGADAIAVTVARDAWRLFTHNLRELPNDGSIVRGMLAQKCRHEALAAFWQAEASRVGLSTEEGIKAQQQATVHAQRSERLMVTVIDISTKLAASKRDDSADAPAWLTAKGNK